MKEKTIFQTAFLLLLSFMLACNCGPGDETKNDVKIEKKETVSIDGKARTIANIGIEGMTCSAGCAGKIKNTLAGLNGVMACDVLFEDKVASIEYDDSKISEKDMIAAIEELNKGQYKVTTVEVEKTVAKSESRKVPEAGGKADEKKKESVRTTPNIEFPNIFEIFRRLY
ncbi:MAG: hypothetical protein COA57_00565 [Flavobacteriales bacterium]|nr:MAG: hypothetical protein COA57_00565 [Flavobacteriales bacterium]